jgi:hypothetical protein
MSDQLDALFRRLQDQPPPAGFAPAAAVRRRGRQRHHRQAASVGAAVLAVAGLGGGGLAVAAGLPGGGAGPAGPALTGSPALPVRPGPTAEAVTGIPLEWLLTPDDFPVPGWQETVSELFESDPPWYWGDRCDRLQVEHPSLRQRLAVDVRGWVNQELPLPGRLDQVVERFDRPELAATNLDEVRQVLELCSVAPSAGADQAGIDYRILAEDLAGDESMLVEERQYFFDGETVAAQPHLRFAAVIRVGGNVTTLVASDQQLVRDLAGVAAARLG